MEAQKRQQELVLRRKNEEVRHKKSLIGITTISACVSLKYGM